MTEKRENHFLKIPIIFFRFKIINPASRSKRPYDIDSHTGDLLITDRIDYETLDTKKYHFDLAVYDAGVPQKSAMARVEVNVGNLNDEFPEFEQPNGYSASVMENAPAGTFVIQVTAIDKDEGDLGIVSYELNHPAFTIGKYMFKLYTNQKKNYLIQKTK